MNKGKNCKWYDVCPLKRYYDRGKLDEKWVARYCWQDNRECVRKKLEEQGIAHPDIMLPDGTIDQSLD